MEYLLIGLAVFAVILTKFAKGSYLILVFCLSLLGLAYYAHLNAEKIQYDLQSAYFDYRMDTVKSKVGALQDKEVSFAKNYEEADASNKSNINK